MVDDAGDVPQLAPVEEHERQVVQQVPEEDAGEDVGGVGVADDGGGRGEVAGVAEAEEDACFFFIVFIVFFFVDEDGVE